MEPTAEPSFYTRGRIIALNDRYHLIYIKVSDELEDADPLAVEIELQLDKRIQEIADLEGVPSHNNYGTFHLPSHLSDPLLGVIAQGIAELHR